MTGPIDDRQLEEAVAAELERRDVEEDRETLPLSLRAFVRKAWPHIEPQVGYIHNWHIDAVCEHLEACSRGDIRHLQIWIPRASMKSRLVSTFWHAWEWTHNPWVRYFTASYDLRLAGRLASDTRDLMMTPWYQARWGHTFEFNREGERYFTNDRGGTRMATATKGGALGEHGHRIIIDDPINWREAEADSGVVLQQANDWYDAVIPGTRLNPYAEVIIMQRLHECLPPDARIRTPDGSRSIASLSAGDEVLTSAGVQNVSAVSSKPHRGDIFHVRCYGHSSPFIATGNHRVMTTQGWVATEDLTIDHVLTFPVPLRTEDRPVWPPNNARREITVRQGTFTGARGKTPPRELVQALVDEGRTIAGIAEGLGYKSRGSAQNALMHYGITRPASRVVRDEILDDEDFWWLVGLWLAEGCIGRSRKKHHSQVRIVLHCDETALLARIERLVHRYGLSTSVSRALNVNHISINSIQMGTFLRENFGEGARHKHLPHWADGLDDEQIAAMFFGYWEGDGCLSMTTRTPTVRVGSASLDLLEGWQRLLLRLGVASSIMTGNTKEKTMEIRPGEPVISRHSWELRFPLSDAPWIAPDVESSPPKYRKLHICGQHLQVPIKQIHREAYEGDVWDIETPSHDFLTGIVTAHNSDLAGHVLVGEFDDWTILCLPERFEAAHPYAWRPPRVHQTVRPRLPEELRNGDPRGEGDLLWAERRDARASDAMAARLTSFRAAGQMQQRPSSREGEILKVDWWRFYDPRYREKEQWAKLPAFGMVVISVDTPLKDKESSDNVAVQCWGVKGADRYLLDLRLGKMNYPSAKRTIKEMALWARRIWRTCPHYVLIENAGYGVELITDLTRELTGVKKVSPSLDGNKITRAESASDALESGNCFLPGYGPPWQPAYDEQRTPADVAAFVANLAAFPNAQHDDDVDAWSQTMNWLRGRNDAPARWTSALATQSRRVPASAR